MIILISAAIGIILGTTTARRRKGTRLDVLQYAAGFGIAFTLLGVFAAILLERLVF